MPVLRHVIVKKLRRRMAHGHFRGILPASSSGWGERRKMLSGVEESWMRETFCYRLSQSNPFLIEDYSALSTSLRSPFGADESELGEAWVGRFSSSWRVA